MLSAPDCRYQDFYQDEVEGASLTQSGRALANHLDRAASPLVAAESAAERARIKCDASLPMQLRCPPARPPGPASPRGAELADLAVAALPADVSDAAARSALLGGSVGDALVPDVPSGAADLVQSRVDAAGRAHGPRHPAAPYPGASFDQAWLHRTVAPHSSPELLVTCPVRGYGAMLDRIAALPPGVVQEMLPDADFHPVVPVALSLTPAWPWPQCVRGRRACHTIHAFTDGSCTDATSGAILLGWSCVLIAEDHEGNFFMAGWMAASAFHDLETLQACGDWTSNAAEMLAITWTLVWALSSKLHFRLQVHTDSAYALGVATLGPTLKQNHVLSQCLAGVAAACRLHRSTTITHVHGHDWHPWNELADGLAKYAAAHDLLLPGPTLASVLAIDPAGDSGPWSPAPWLFLHLLDDDTRSAYPIIIDDRLLVPRPRESMYPDAALRPAVFRAAPPSAATRRTLRLCTYNPMTLDYSAAKKGPEGLLAPRKMAGLQAQFEDLQMDAVGIQESRCPKDALISTKHYVCVCSAALKGQGGCQLWLRRGGKYGCRPQHCLVLLSEHRILIVAVQGPLITATFIVFHAPHSGADAEVLQAFWDRLNTWVDKLRATGRDVVLLGDTNATLGSETSVAVGGHAPEPQGIGGQLFHELLVEHSLWLPSTFENTVADAHADARTWRSPAGDVACRIDYIAVPMTWAARSCRSHVVYDFDTLSGLVDHLPVALTVEWTSGGWADFPQRRAPICDRTSMGDPVAGAAFAAAVAAIPACPASCNIHDQLAWTLAAVRREAAAAFPLVAKPRKPYLAPQTWALVQSRRQFRVAALGAAGQRKQLLRQLCLAGWHAVAVARSDEPGTTELEGAQRVRAAITETFFQEAAARFQLEGTRAPLRSMLCRDKKNFVDEVQNQVSEAATRGDAQAMFGGLRRLQRFQPRPPPAVALRDGTLATTPDAALARWREFTRGVHDGAQVTPATLVERADALATAFRGVPRQADQVPSLAELAKVYSKLHPRRACGEDSLPPEIFISFPMLMARLLHPITTKAALTLVEPVQWRGGMLGFFPKNAAAGAAAGAICANNREIVLADVAGKAFHKTRRQRLVPYAEAAARPSQMGGISHRGTDFGSLAIRCLAELCKGRGLSYAFAFVDISAAFYNLRRRYLMPDELTLSPQGHTVCNNALAKLGCSAHAAAAAAAATQAAWFTLQHDEEYTTFAKGVLPGDPEADLLFTVVILDALNEIHERLLAAGLIEPLLDAATTPAFAAHLPGEYQPPPEISFVDDSVFVIVGAATTICRRAAQAFAIIEEVFGRFGLPVNFAPGKSEVLLGLHGKGSKLVRAEVYSERVGRLQVQLAAGTASVVITDAYKHLGAYISSDTGMKAEVTHRISALWAAVRPIARNFYKSDRFDPAVKQLTLQPLLLSRLLFNSPTWNVLCSADAKRLNGAFLRVLHLVCGTAKHDFEDPLVHRRVLVRAGLPSLEDLMRVQRLNFLPRLLTWGPPFLLKLLDACGHFRHTLVEDLVWLASRAPKLADMPEPHLELSTWLDMARLHRLAWKSYLRSAQAAAVLALKCEWERTLAEAEVSASLEVGEPAALHLVAQPFFCYECNVAFRSATGMRMHRQMRHGMRSNVEAAVHETYCLACLKDFHTVDRLVPHLRAGDSRCGSLVLLNVGPAAAGRIADLRLASRAAAVELKRHRRRPPPAVRVCGPLPPWA